MATTLVHRLRPCRRAAFQLCGLVLCTTTLRAQAVRGDLVDHTDNRPIQGAFVTLLNTSGVEVARALTAANGTFLLHAPSPGTFRLRSKRIGFRPTESAPLIVGEGETLEYHLEVEAIPVELPAVIVRGKPQCGAQPEAAAVAQLWEEAREALAAVKWTEEQRTLRYTVDSFDRALPRVGRRVLSERDSAWAGLGPKPFESVSAEQLAAEGYVVAAQGDSVDYYAPDAEVLLGDVFMDTHCFSATDGGPEHPDLVGLQFEPDPRRKLPDVAGVLWLNRRTLELEFLGFHYTHLRDNSLGGRVEFARLASGPWIVTHWWIRTPRLDPTARRRRRPTILDYRESGGTVTAITSPTGTVEYSGEWAVLEGLVVDSSRGGVPLAGAIASLAGTRYRSLAGTRYSPLTDDGGRFQLAGPFDGEYSVSFRHPRLDSLGIEADTQRVILGRGLRRPVTLLVPPESVVVRRLWPGSREPDAPVLVGVVRDSAWAQVPRARVSVQLASGAKQGGRADDAGRFVICEVPAGPITINASADQGVGSVVVEFKDGGAWIDGRAFHVMRGRVWKQDIRLRPEAD